MRQGITTRYIGPSNVRGSRIKAIARKANRDRDWKEMSHTRSYGYEGTDKEHTLAAKELATKLGWSGLWIGGGKPEEDGNQYVNFGDMREHAPLGREDEDWFWVERPEPR